MEGECLTHALRPQRSELDCWTPTFEPPRPVIGRFRPTVAFGRGVRCRRARQQPQARDGPESHPRELTQTDTLTGLKNRRALNVALENEWDRLQRNDRLGSLHSERRLRYGAPL